MKDLFKKIEKLLDSSNIKYQILKHVPVYTSTDAARIRGTDISEGAKALIFIADKKPIVVVVAGDKKVDTKKFKKLFSFKDLRMATAEEVKEVSGVEIGAVAPFGDLMGIETFVDKDFEKKENIVFNAGKHEVSIRMRVGDYLRVVKPKIEDFSFS